MIYFFQLLSNRLSRMAIGRIKCLIITISATSVSYRAVTVRTSKSAIVRSTADVNDVCFINGSRILFLHLQSHLKFVEEMLLQPAIGDKLYEHLIDGLVNQSEDEGRRKDGKAGTSTPLSLWTWEIYTETTSDFK